MTDTTKVPPPHFGQRRAGQVLEWMPTDTEELHKQNLQDPAFVAIANKHGWTAPQSITYCINSQGFRGKEFDSTADNLLTLGCSFTIGIGLRESETWPYLLGSQLGLHVHNIAWGGWSADTLFRMAQYWIPQLRPSLVVLLTPSAARMELATGNALYETITPTDPISHDNYLQHWFANQENYELNRLKNILAIEMICKQSNIKFMHYLQDEEMTGRVLTNPTNVARDNMHCGTESHVNLVEKIIKDLRG